MCSLVLKVLYGVNISQQGACDLSLQKFCMALTFHSEQHVIRAFKRFVLLFHLNIFSSALRQILININRVSLIIYETQQAKTSFNAPADSKGPGQYNLTGFWLFKP